MPRREATGDRTLRSSGAGSGAPTAPSSPQPEEPASRQDAVRIVSAARPRIQRALASLISQGPRSEVPGLLDELSTSEKRSYSLLALIPVVGPLLIAASKRHTDDEKRRLSALSIGLTVAVLALLWTLQPSPAAQAARLRQRVESEMRVLSDIAEQYRKERGSYPTEATWRRFTERPDVRFFDPWGRPYLYERVESGFVLKTLGQDGFAGGIGKDADVTLEERSAPSNSAEAQ